MPRGEGEDDEHDGGAEEYGGQRGGEPPISQPPAQYVAEREADAHEEQRVGYPARRDMRDVVQHRRDIGEYGEDRSRKYHGDGESHPDREFQRGEFAQHVWMLGFWL